MTDAVLTVGQLTRSIKSLLEGTYPFVWVRGQVSNVSRPSSGHLYFSLKDEEALLPAVWFKRQQKAEELFDPLTGEVFEDGPRPGMAARLENGQEVTAAGTLTVYPPRGAYQLVVELVQDAGVSRLYQEFERMKAVLDARGFFSQERKRPLPRNPRRVAVVTAPAGAALRDFLRMAEERGSGAELRVYPSLVQGDEAPARLAAALDAACADGWAEVIVLIRGGGSLEDLWAFNTLEVAEALFRAQLPVLAGVGHEVDVSIADLVADARAATPTHAAQLWWVEKRELAQRLDELDLALAGAWRRCLSGRADRLAALERHLALLSPVRALERREERVLAAAQRLRQAMTARLGLPGLLLESLARRLSATAPERALIRHGERLESLRQRLGQAQERRLERAAQSLEVLAPRLDGAHNALLSRKERDSERLGLRLAALDPKLPLERGYALARLPDGSFARSVYDAPPGQRLDLVLRDGEVPVEALERAAKQNR